MKKRRQPAAERHARFVQEYLKDLNATKAAQRAGYSKKTARQTGTRLLSHTAIAAAIRAAIAARAERTGITQDRVLRELEQLAFSNVDHYTIEEASGRVVLREGAPTDALKAVAKVKHKITTKEVGSMVITEREVEIALWDKPGTLKLAGRHIGLFPDRLELSGRGGGPILTQQATAQMSDAELKAALTQALETLP